MSSYAGQTVMFAFAGAEDSQKQTSFVVDDTARTHSEPVALALASAEVLWPKRAGFRLHVPDVMLTHVCRR